MLVLIRGQWTLERMLVEFLENLTFLFGWGDRPICPTSVQGQELVPAQGVGLPPDDKPLYSCLTLRMLGHFMSHLASHSRLATQKTKWVTQWAHLLSMIPKKESMWGVPGEPTAISIDQMLIHSCIVGLASETERCHPVISSTVPCLVPQKITKQDRVLSRPVRITKWCQSSDILGVSSWPENIWFCLPKITANKMFLN